ncbi:hypothetical protein K458DRAFT_248758, partial [Lentithecium fluviatile CBS 122367]
RLFCISWSGLLCCGLVVATLIGIIVTIRSYDSKPLPQWPYGKSINTFIAAYVVLMKTAAGLVLAEGISRLKWTSLRKPRYLHNFAAHDEASRGPWGAILLICSNRGRDIPSLGAFITVMILLLEPFSQQIVRFYDCSQISTETVASIPRANVHYERELHVSAGTEIVPYSIRNAFHQGLFATLQPHLPISCPTGNCTFPVTYSSLAYCSSC